MSLRTGDFVRYAGREWEIESFTTDDQGYLVTTLIDPQWDLSQGGESPSVAVRDLEMLTKALRAA